MYIAKMTFPSEYGSFTEKKKMKFTKRPTKKIMQQWIDLGLCEYQPDNSDDVVGDDDEIEVGPPTTQEGLESADTPLRPPALPPTTPLPGTPARSVDQGTLSGKK